MGLWLFLIFVGLPIVEIALFILVGGAIGVLPTLMLVVLAAVVGIGIVRMQGLTALARLQETVDRGGDPVGPIADGALKAIAGLLLMVPGFLTDALGLLLLLPPVRRALHAPGRGAGDGAGDGLCASPAGGQARDHRGRLRDRRRRRAAAARRLGLDAAAVSMRCAQGRLRARPPAHRQDGKTPWLTRATARPPRRRRPRLQILTQYVRDLSFENIAAQKGARLGRQARRAGGGQHRRPARSGGDRYEVALKLKVDSKLAEAPVFILELDYAGLFLIQNVPQEQLTALLMIECPRLIFPYVRRIVGDVTRDGGYPPLNLEQIDFMALYRPEIARRQAAGGPGAGLSRTVRFWTSD